MQRLILFRLTKVMVSSMTPPNFPSSVLNRIPNPFVFWKLWVAVLAPLLLLPVPLLGAEENRDALWCGWTILVMAVFWISECLPLAITSLLPLVLLPLAGVSGTKEVSVHYLGATNMMFVAGLMMAVAVEHCGLHHRIALAILSLVGTSPALIMLGFMACSMFLSMWISNTACTAMMVLFLAIMIVILFIHFYDQQEISKINHFPPGAHSRCNLI